MLTISVVSVLLDCEMSIREITNRLIHRIALPIFFRNSCPYLVNNTSLKLKLDLHVERIREIRDKVYIDVLTII